MISFVNDISYNYFVKPEYNIEKLNENIIEVKDNVSNVTQNTIKQKEDSSFFNKVMEKFDSGFYEKKIEEYTNAVNNSSNYIVDLIIVFIFQTIVLPIVFLFVLYFFTKALFNIRKS